MRLPLFARALFLAAGCMALFPGTANAYLDPGTGSMLVSALVGIAATAFFAFKTFYYKAAGLLCRLRGVSAPSSGKNAIVVYSEGGRYWNTFKHLLAELDNAGEKALYLTSGEDDPGLSHPFKNVTARHIGRGNRAFAAMNTLEAAVCVMTTPGLDVLQIRRSPGVKHYAHLVHAPTDAAMYKLYSFDYFDSVLCSGPHQMRTLRHLENLRGTREKLLLQTGCPYMDVLAEELEALGGKRAEAPAEKPRILVAPTWGANGLLSRFGVSLLRPLVDAGFSVTVRPHPQSRFVERGLLEKIEKHFASSPGLAWDHAASPLPAMLRTDVLVSDLSGIVFDYAFILERPVVTVSMDADLRGLEAGDLPYPAWELTKLPELGASVLPGDIADLPGIIASFPPAEEFAAKMRALREESLFNFRGSGALAAGQIMELKKMAVKNAD